MSSALRIWPPPSLVRVTKYAIPAPAASWRARSTQSTRTFLTKSLEPTPLPWPLQWSGAAMNARSASTRGTPFQPPMEWGTMFLEPMRTVPRKPFARTQGLRTRWTYQNFLFQMEQVGHNHTHLSIPATWFKIACDVWCVRAVVCTSTCMPGHFSFAQRIHVRTDRSRAKCVYDQYEQQAWCAHAMHAIKVLVR